MLLFVEGFLELTDFIYKHRRPQNTTSDAVTPDQDTDSPDHTLDAPWIAVENSSKGDAPVTFSPDDDTDMNENNTHNIGIQVDNT